MFKNNNLRLAKERKNDEFYTFYEDIEKEVSHHISNLEGKTIYCPCDNPTYSNFWKYLKDNFHKFKLRKLISTYYNSLVETGISTFFEDNKEVTYKTEYDGKEEKKVPLSGNGDFRSEECTKILQECDIVITNPPFSLFREFISWIRKYNKDFLLLGNQNLFTSKNIFPLLQKRKIFIGYNYGSFSFFTPNENEIKKFGCICWYMSFPIVPPQKLQLTKKYDERINIKYEKYDVINVDKITDIPYDYDGIMGVPITFLYKWNPKQFTIVGVGGCEVCGDSKIKYIQYGTNKEIPYGKINLYRKFIPSYDKNYSFTIDGSPYVHVYKRIFIQRIKD